jgi:hypothetical protein
MYNDIKTLQILMQQQQSSFLFNYICDGPEYGLRRSKYVTSYYYNFNSINLFTCLTTARKGQLLPSTETTVHDKKLYTEIYK